MTHTQFLLIVTAVPLLVWLTLAADAALQRRRRDADIDRLRAAVDQRRAAEDALRRTQTAVTRREDDR